MTNRFKISLKALMAFIAFLIEFAEMFADKTIEIRVRMLLGTTLDNHVDQFDQDMLSPQQGAVQQVTLVAV